MMTSKISTASPDTADTTTFYRDLYRSPEFGLGFCLGATTGITIMMVVWVAFFSASTC